MDTDNYVTIYTDGACQGNPGPGGWGVTLLSRNGKKSRELSGAVAHTTNSRMEMTAAIEALKALKEPLPVRLHSDANFMVKGIKEWLPGWKQKGWRRSGGRKVENADLWQELDRLNQIHRVEWIWVKGHSGIPGNERADFLANSAIDQLLKAE